MNRELPRTERLSLGEKSREFLMTGGLTPFVFLLAWGLRRVFGLDDAEFFVGATFFYAAHLINNPHFAVTYLLFYRRIGTRLSSEHVGRAQALRFALSGFVVPVVLVFWIGYTFVARSPNALGLLIQGMFLLVGWHYAKQAFGVLSVLSARRGYRLSKSFRSWSLFHAYASWAYAWASPAHDSKLVEESGVVYRMLAQPLWLERVTLVVFIVSALGFFFRLAREPSKPPLGPLLGYLVTLWFLTVWTSLDPLVVYAIPALHSLQYLYFVHRLKKGEFAEGEFSAPVGSRLALFAVASIALGWLILRGLPELLDGASGRIPPFEGALGATPYFAAFFAFVNIHHYFMDHVVWRRENPEMKALFRTSATTVEAR